MAFIISDFKSISKMTKSGVKVNPGIVRLSHRVTTLSFPPEAVRVLKLKVPHFGHTPESWAKIGVVGILLSQMLVFTVRL